jgi:hypothetical protein
MGKSTISMAIFTSFLYVYQRVMFGKDIDFLGKNTGKLESWSEEIGTMRNHEELEVQLDTKLDYQIWRREFTLRLFTINHEDFPEGLRAFE